MLQTIKLSVEVVNVQHVQPKKMAILHQSSGCPGLGLTFQQMPSLKDDCSPILARLGRKNRFWLTVCLRKQVDVRKCFGVVGLILTCPGS
jgi:hypothetical protein